MKPGDICLTALPQSDDNIKVRPVLLLSQMPGYKDWLACGISSQIQKQLADWDILIKQNDSGFIHTGLKKPSIIRLSFLSVLPAKKIIGTIGFIDKNLLYIAIERICKHLENVII